MLVGHADQLLLRFGDVRLARSGLGEHDVELRVPHEAGARARHAGVADPFAVLPERDERVAGIGAHDELGRHALVHDVDDGAADRAEVFGHGLVFVDDA